MMMRFLTVALSLLLVRCILPCRALALQPSQSTIRSSFINSYWLIQRDEYPVVGDIPHNAHSMAIPDSKLSVVQSWPFMRWVGDCGLAYGLSTSRLNDLADAFS